jgi:uncharacterized membrane protein YfcA
VTARHDPVKALATALLIGLLAGLVGALCGVGGGIIMVPAFTLVLGLEQRQAVATSLVVIVVTALAATASNLREPGLVDWRLVALTAVGAALAAWFGAEWMRTLSNHTLTRIFAIALIAIGAWKLWKG